MSIETIKKIIQRMCIDTFGKTAIIPWDLDEIANILSLKSPNLGFLPNLKYPLVASLKATLLKAF